MKAGLILMRRDPEGTKRGVKIWQFLKVDERMQVSRQGSQKVQTEGHAKTNKDQHKALTKAIQSLQPGEENDSAFDKMWLAIKSKNVALEDCGVTASEDEDPMEDEEAEENQKEQFLVEIAAAGLQKSQSSCQKITRKKQGSCRERKTRQESSCSSCRAKQVGGKG